MYNNNDESLVQQLEQSLDINPLINYVQNLLEGRNALPKDDVNDGGDLLSQNNLCTEGTNILSANVDSLIDGKVHISNKHLNNPIFSTFFNVDLDSSWLENAILDNESSPMYDYNESAMEEEVRKEMKYLYYRKRLLQNKKGCQYSAGSIRGGEDLFKNNMNDEIETDFEFNRELEDFYNSELVNFEFINNCEFTNNDELLVNSGELVNDNEFLNGGKLLNNVKLISDEELGNRDELLNNGDLFDDCGIFNNFQLFNESGFVNDQPVLKTVLQPVLKSAPQSVLKPVLQPVLKPAPQPVLKPILKPVLISNKTKNNVVNNQVRRTRKPANVTRSVQTQEPVETITTTLPKKRAYNKTGKYKKQPKTQLKPSKPPTVATVRPYLPMPGVAGSKCINDVLFPNFSTIPPTPPPHPQRQRRARSSHLPSPTNLPPVNRATTSNGLFQIPRVPSIRKRPCPPLTPAAIRKDKKRKIERAQSMRKKLWSFMNKKEICKVHKHRVNKTKDVQQNMRKVILHYTRFWKQKVLQSQKCQKEIYWRGKRLVKEMHMYWKRFDRVERENKRRIEKEAEEQRKINVELLEVKRQQRKLNFLITQTELYAHFMSRKMSTDMSDDQNRILNQLDEDTFGDNNSEIVKEQAMQNVSVAFEADRMRTSSFGGIIPFSNVENLNEERPQPTIFNGSLKHYQLVGLNWLANLYDQGINGILADEMGLGKTVQSIAFLCYIAEKYNIWGPFLIVTPASTLFNWQQEFARFAPKFKVVPYWGNPQERKILRQFWELKGIHTEDASFHVVITNYQLIVTDIKYFNRVQWQYLILDEAQAIKSTNSMRWKLLLGFKCRNRLLLSGTPIQNSMAELWALLHFIMPSMFDSHDEFNEWFSKDIESHAENKTNIDEKHLTRLHLILKPFMLRRIKKDVENELSDKIEIMVYCPLTSRQKILYAALRQKIKIEDLLHEAIAQIITSNLMNLVMQFRKVCNHPELFERRETKSPLCLKNDDFVIPRQVFDDVLLHRKFPSQQHLLYNKFNIFTPDYILNRRKIPGTSVDSSFSAAELIGLSTAEINKLAFDGVFGRWMYFLHLKNKQTLSEHQRLWHRSSNNTDTSLLNCEFQRVPSKFIFCSNTSDKAAFSFDTVTHHSMPETMEHRLMRSIKATTATRLYAEDHRMADIQEDSSEHVTLLPEFHHVKRESIVRECLPLPFPKSLFRIYPKVTVRPKLPVCSSRRSTWYLNNLTKFNSVESQSYFKYGDLKLAEDYERKDSLFTPIEIGGIEGVTKSCDWSFVDIPGKEMLLSDSGKLFVLDGLLKKLKEEGHRVLIYSQMTKMIDILEEYMTFRKHRYMRLDGSSKISERRDMVEDFQTRSEIFVFLLSTRAGGVGINLTAADTVIFYDSDWNPTIDEQAMDRAHRLGQTKQVTVYRLICKNTIEERILQRAREKSEIQRMVISGGDAKQEILKPKEVVSLLLDDEETEQKYRQKQLERRQLLDEKPSVIEPKQEDDPNILPEINFLDMPPLSDQFLDLDIREEFQDILPLNDQLNCMELEMNQDLLNELDLLDDVSGSSTSGSARYVDGPNILPSYPMSPGSPLSPISPIAPRGRGRKRGRPPFKNRLERSLPPELCSSLIKRGKATANSRGRTGNRRGRGRPRLYTVGGGSSNRQNSGNKQMRISY